MQTAPAAANTTQPGRRVGVAHAAKARHGSSSTASAEPLKVPVRKLFHSLDTLASTSPTLLTDEEPAEARG